MMKYFKQKFSKNQRSIQNTLLESLFIYTLLDRYGDILQGKFEESYHKLAYKSMSALLWTQEYCKNVGYCLYFQDMLYYAYQVPWIVKTDDDTVMMLISSFGHMPMTASAYKVLYWLWSRIVQHMRSKTAS